MEQSILELVLNYYRSPSQYPELVDVATPLPQGIDFLLDLVSGKVELDTNELQGELEGVPVAELKAASVSYIEHVFFNSNADFYRTLGLNSNATQDQIRHHYGALIHILCLDQDDKAAQWDEAYAMRINRAYSVLRIPEKREKYNKKNNIVISGFSGIERRSESRKVLEGDSEADTEQQPKNVKGRLSSSFIATNIDRAYLSKESTDVVAEVPVVDTVAESIDSASPENLYEQDETVSDEKKSHSEQSKKTDDEPVNIRTEPPVAVDTKKSEQSNIDKPLSRKGTYSLLGFLLLVAMGVAIVYFSGSLKPESDHLHGDDAIVSETENIQEPEKVIENIPDEDVVVDVKEDVVDLNQEQEQVVESEERAPAESEEKEMSDVIEAQPIETFLNEVDSTDDIAEIDAVDSEIVTEHTEKENEVEALVDEDQVMTEFKAEDDVTEIFEMDDDVSELADTFEDVIDDSMSDDDVLSEMDSEVLTDEANQEMDNEAEAVSIEEEAADDGINTEKLSAVVHEFVRYYNSGDLDKFIALFAEDAKTDDRENVSGIREDYADAFNLTVKRKFLIDDVQWVMLDENNGLGSADFVLFIQALGEDRFAEYTGEITFYIENRDGTLLITGLYHQYSE